MSLFRSLLLCAALLFASVGQAQPVVAEQIDLIRHGESEDNPDTGQPVVQLSGHIVASSGKVLSGWNAAPLTMRGVAQAVQAGEALKAREAQAVVPLREAAWVYSPLLRTQQTLAGVLTGAGIADPSMLRRAEPDTRLFERSAGVLTNLTWEQAAARWDEMKKGREAAVFQHADAAYPGGESLALVHARAAAALDERLARHRRVVVVSHELTIKALLSHLLRGRIDDAAFAYKVENAKPLTLRRAGDAWVLQP
jgi:broad specificity phosphatase PhoE